MRSLFSVILFIVSVGTVLCMQEDSTHSAFRILSNDGSVFLDHASELLTSPMRFSSEEWKITGAIVMSTAILLNADGPVRNGMRHQHSSMNDRLASIGNTYGDGLYGFALATGLYAGGFIIRHDEVRKTGLILIESLAFATAISTAGKYIISRSRPTAEEGTARFSGFRTDYAHTSFPSAHATVAFTISSVLAERFDQPILTIGLYSLATLTSLSRVYKDQHWLSDTFTGAVLGTVCGLSVSHLYVDRQNRMSLHITPMINGLRSEIRF
jgi:hypothetical protein